MNNFKIIADGGLANRLNCLIGGLIISDRLGFKPIVHWSPNNWCGCYLNDLYEPYFEYDDKSITKIYDENPNSIYYIHENQLNKNINHLTIEKNYNNLLSIDQDIIYYNSLLPSYITNEEFLTKLNQLKIKKDVLDRVKNFCIDNNIDKNNEGIHLRMTDFGGQTNVSHAMDYVTSKPNKKFFVCSDDESVENNFSYLHNVVTFKKTMYVEKLNPNSDWNGNITDSEGRSFRFNVNRNRVSVIESFIDLLILSRNGNRLVTSESSFLKFSENYSQINIF
jgi:hypothetical protein